MSLSPLRRTAQRARMLDGIERLRGTGRVEFGHSQEAPTTFALGDGDGGVLGDGDNKVLGEKVA